MTTLISHPLPILALGVALGSRVIGPRLMLAGALLACLPDADVLAFKLGIAYSEPLGHRGASHSLLFAAACGLLLALCSRWLQAGALKAGLWGFLACASHALLDALTNGGLGVAFAWPWHNERYFLPWRPIQVSPFINGFFSARGLAVLMSEVRWVWLPCLLLAGSGMGLRLWIGGRRSDKIGGEQA